MARDNYETVWNRVLLQCPAAGSFLAQQWVSHAFREVAERHVWSWSIKRGQFIMPAVYSTGTVTVTQSSATVAGSSTVWTAAMVGRQFRAGSSLPIYTISEFKSATSVVLDQPWGGVTAAGQTYEIYQAYVTPPDDFESFLSVWDPAHNWRLHLHRQQVELQIWDAQRTNSGDAYVVAAADYSTSRAGAVEAVLQVGGTGPDPSITADSSYTGANDAIFAVEVTTGGTVGVAVYQWKKDGGAYTTGVTTAGTAQQLADGVSIYWPAETYVEGDVFVVRVASQSSPGIPRYELWPHKKADYVYPYLYEASVDDLEDSGAVLPRNIRGDILLEYALSRAAMWPGTEGKKNVYYDLTLSARHKSHADMMVRGIEKSDEETYMQSLSYISEMAWAPSPFGDSAWLQTHAI